MGARVSRHKDKTPDNTPDKPSGNTATAVKWGGGAVVALAAVTGLIFLPEEIVEGVQNALFGWLPEEQRPAACASCCYSSCCCLSLLIAVAIFFAVKK